MDFDQLTTNLAEKRLTISAAESLTAGNFQTNIAATKHASQVYPGGFITYSTISKTKLLTIDPGLIKQYGVVSAQTAEAMAISTQKLLDVDVALGFTGAAGPTGLDGEPVGRVWIGITYANQIWSANFNFTGTPTEIMDQSCQAGIELIAQHVF
ncbi:CinA family protein [Paucilactobacillus kaifaensis]|uniref:CinA family protein n=1 Tax=Paucilactobacillus kaifaensis TaxID=2559921 RepID=UPI0010F78C2F|nr:CinA family protein [Paucilactobacillus kaifaensis]